MNSVRNLFGCSTSNIRHLIYAGWQIKAEQILVAAERMFHAMGNPAEMVQQAKMIARAVPTLAHAMKVEAESQSDTESQADLLAVRKELCDGTARMVEAGKAAAVNPHDNQCQLALQQVRLLSVNCSSIFTIIFDFKFHFLTPQCYVILITCCT